MGKNSSLTSNWALKDLEETLLLYSKLRVLNTMYDNCFRYTFHPVFNTICGAMCVICLFLLMKTSTISDVSVFGLCFFLGAGCISVMVAVAKLTSCISTDSKNLQNSIQKRVRNQLQYRVTKAFSTFGIEMGDFHRMQRGTPLVLLKILFDTTTTMLLSIDF
ncbi:unnamed protein product [Orchesella dallaii]|uniref:Uncharacterized protein n=1 Tax=Orchesella dallaii TaxID=48710 RepID=A0ABP1QRV4_9HEXA